MDVSVIGGGPAGSAVAIGLARRGVAVRLIEAEVEAEKPGEVLAPTAVPGLAGLGLGEDLLARDHLPCPGIDRVWGGAHVARVDFAGRMQRRISRVIRMWSPRRISTCTPKLCGATASSGPARTT